VRRWKRDRESGFAHKAEISAWLKTVSDQIDSNVIGQGVDLYPPSQSSDAPASVGVTVVGDHALDADGLSYEFSHLEPGWRFRCVCGWQSPHFETADEGRRAFTEHATSTAEPARKLWHRHSR
jgi:hypothetical protein